LKGFEYQHNSSTYLLPSDMPPDIGPQNDPNVRDIDRAIDTRAAVGLLTRNIQIVSEGDDPSKTFSEMPSNYYNGGHTIVRQGFASYQVQGAEFAYLGQGAIGRYPVHFHMARKTPQPKATSTYPTPSPLNYLKDCSIHDSMTRFVTIHATQGMYIARNVGFKWIGHGYYFEDATEVNNKLYANLGVLAQAAIQDKVHNPRQVPGILADKTGGADNMPYSSDVNHPTVFWIMNGWNDFEYNMAAGRSNLRRLLLVAAGLQQRRLTIRNLGWLRVPADRRGEPEFQPRPRGSHAPENFCWQFVRGGHELFSNELRHRRLLGGSDQLGHQIATLGGALPISYSGAGSKLGDLLSGCDLVAQSRGLQDTDGRLLRIFQSLRCRRHLQHLHRHQAGPLHYVLQFRPDQLLGSVAAQGVGPGDEQCHHRHPDGRIELHHRRRLHASGCGPGRVAGGAQHRFCRTHPATAGR